MSKSLSYEDIVRARMKLKKQGYDVNDLFCIVRPRPKKPKVWSVS